MFLAPGYCWHGQAGKSKISANEAHQLQDIGVASLLGLELSAKRSNRALFDLTNSLG